MACPEISIITVAYNSAETIRRTIESVLAQTDVSLEYIIVDGGSSDGTVEIIKEYSDQLDYWVSERDNGIYDAMNKGLCRATGSIIGLLNADDVYNNSVLKAVCEASCENPNSVIHGNVDIVNAGECIGVWRGNNPKGVSSQFHKMTINHPAAFIPKAVYDKFGLYSTKYRLSSDYDLILRLIDNDVNFFHIDFSVTRFSLGGSSGGLKTYRETLEIQRKFGRDFISSELWFWKSLFKMGMTKLLPKNVVGMLTTE